MDELKKDQSYIRTEPREGIQMTYANHVEVGRTAFDLRILFGEVLGAKDGVMVVEQRMHVTLPWLQAKLLARLLTQVVENFEAANGPITLPKLTALVPFEPEKEV